MAASSRRIPGRYVDSSASAVDTVSTDGSASKRAERARSVIGVSGFANQPPSTLMVAR